jgi:hypothetical protein
MRCREDSQASSCQGHYDRAFDIHAPIPTGDNQAPARLRHPVRCYGAPDVGGP